MRLSYVEATGEVVEPHSSDVCSLCESHHNRMSKVQTRQNEQATQYIQTLGIELDSLIWRPCRDVECWHILPIHLDGAKEMSEVMLHKELFRGVICVQ